MNDRSTGSLPPRDGRRERRKRDARERLYEAALRLFRTRGYDATTVQAIADAADAAKGTFFNHFPTKEHVLAEYHDRMAGDVLAAAESRAHDSAESAVQDVLRECAAYAVNDPAIGRVLLRVMFAGDVLMHADRRNEERLQEHLRDRVVQGVRRRQLRADLDVELFLSMLVGTLSATVTEWVVGDAAFDLEGTLRRKVALLFDAVRTAPRGHP